MGKFDGADLQEAYTHEQGKDDRTVTIASRSHQIGSKVQAWAKKASPPGLNISPANDP